MTYSKVIRLEFFDRGYSLHAFISSLRGNFLFIGTISFLNSSFVACKEIANLESTSLPHLIISGTMPEVLRVILLVDNCIPSLSPIISAAFLTFS